MSEYQYFKGFSSEANSKACETPGGGEMVTQQQFGVEADINTIVKRFGLTREMPSGPAGGMYGDFTGITDFASAVEAVDRAREGFLALDPEVRERFGNDPGAYLRHVASLSDEELEKVSSTMPAPEPAVVPPVPAAGVLPVP